MRHELDFVTTELNHQKGIWCEWCGKDCTDEHLIRITNKIDERLVAPICTVCARNLIACLKLSLMDSLLIDKEKP